MSEKHFQKMDFTPELMNFTTTTVVNIKSHREQQEKLIIARLECEERIANDSLTPHKEPFCETVWDDVMCWDSVPAGTVSQLHCPEYINGISKDGFAVRECTENGTWFSLPGKNKTWTDYSGCVPSGQSFADIMEHLPKIRLMYNIGYGISLCSLLVAVVIMICCRRLHSKSNTMHINLFIAFILRAIMSFLKESLFVNGLGLKKDLITRNGKSEFIQDDPHWECKLLYSIFVYGVSTSCMWIFMEALYLHMLVYRTLWTERNGVKMYMVLGWFGPLIFIIPWIIVRATLEDELCWNTNPTPHYIWIITGPILLTTVINFIFFVNIARVLFIRVHTNKRVTGARKVRKLAKFIVVLIPLFGVMYIVFNVMYRTELNADTDIPYLYCEMFYNSFQGFFLALLFCFLNEEVHVEFKKLWYRYALRRKDSNVYTRTAVLSSWRHNSQSRAHSVNEPSTDSNTGQLRQFRTTRNNNDKLLAEHTKSKSNSNSPIIRSRLQDSKNKKTTSASGKKLETCVNSNCRFLAIRDKRSPKIEEIPLKDKV